MQVLKKAAFALCTLAAAIYIYKTVWWHFEIQRLTEARDEAYQSYLEHTK